MKNILLTLSVVAAATFITVSCGNSNPTLGDRIASEGNAVADIGKNWQKGEDMIKRGEKMKRNGKRGIEKGEDLIKKGRSTKKKAESAYELKSGT